MGRAGLTISGLHQNLVLGHEEISKSLMGSCGWMPLYVCESRSVTSHTGLGWSPSSEKREVTGSEKERERESLEKEQDPPLLIAV